MAKSTECPKCSATELTVQYRKESTADKAKDCLDRKCNTCKYAWEDPCDDA